MGAVSVFTKENYSCQLLLRHGSLTKCQLEDNSRPTSISNTRTQHHTLKEEPKAIPTYQALYKMYRNTRVYVSFAQETTRFSRYEMCRCVQWRQDIGAVAKNG